MKSAGDLALFRNENPHAPELYLQYYLEAFLLQDKNEAALIMKTSFHVLHLCVFPYMCRAGHIRPLFIQVRPHLFWTL